MIVMFTIWMLTCIVGAEVLCDSAEIPRGAAYPVLLGCGVLAFSGF